MKKLLVISIIFLFIGVAIAPSINFNVVKASNDNDLVEVTTQACGIKGFGNTTVKLTKQQYQNLEQYLVDFRARLNKTTTREEAVPIFKEAVVELNKYGLLPRGMSVEQAQKLVMGRYQNLQRFSEYFNIRNHLTLNDTENRFCLIAGKASHTVFYWPSLPFDKFGNILVIIIYLFGPFEGSLFFLCLIFSFLWRSQALIHIGSSITFGEYYWYEGGFTEYYPSAGWVRTYGLNGVVNWNGTFYGQISKRLALFQFGPFWDAYEFIGATGFSGIRIDGFFFGSALRVSLGSEPLDR